MAARGPMHLIYTSADRVAVAAAQRQRQQSLVMGGLEVSLLVAVAGGLTVRWTLVGQTAQAATVAVALSV